ncbi:response regulator transcription factor [Blautia pseudococcoides]|uniref:response regulator n=1 Tax=Blautia pseudococcoides TaxID=1796616 RepID=UPI00148AF1BD|nr:response regulator transcription factor [Blautia pseudococcoides]QJU16060.1 response regulator transcription factor [Blautia pseudococcoides]
MKVIIVDDDPFVCISLKTILQAEPDIEVCASGNSGEAAVRLYEDMRPDILLMDIQMGDFSGLDAGAEILEKHPEARILFLTTFSDDEYIVRALRIGAKGYLIKQDIETIAPALRSVMSGQSVFGSEIVTRIPKMMERSGSIDLSRYGILDREMDVIELVAKGLNNKEIAQSLYLSEGTVRNYLSAILDKLSLRDRTQLAVFYYKNMEN